MGFTNKLLILAAKVALDQVMGRERTDELEKLLVEWKHEREKAKQLAMAKREAADAIVVQMIDAALALEENVTISESQRERIAFAVSSGVAAFKRNRQLKSRREKTSFRVRPRPLSFILRIRISGETAQAASSTSTGTRIPTESAISSTIESCIRRRRTQTKEGHLEPVHIEMSALDVWKASSVRIHSTKRYGLGFAIDKPEQWKAVLSLLTETAQQMSKP